MKTTKKSNGLLPVAVIALIAIAAEIFLSNAVWLFYVAGNNGVSDFSPQGGVYSIAADSNSFTVDGLDFSLNSISFNIKSDDFQAQDRLVETQFYVSDEAGTALVRSEKTAVGASPRRATVYLNSCGKAKSLTVVFGDFKSDMTVSAVTVNPGYRFSFNTVRASALFILIVAVYVLMLGGSGKALRGQMSFNKASVCAVAVCAAAAAAMWLLCASKDGLSIIAYPLEGGIEKYSPYIQQFDAFMKGQLHIDVQPAAELLALENPYNPVERSGIYYLFDRAFYGGKYYSYFGIAPILTVYFPFYLLCGALPDDSTVMGIFSLITAVFMPLAVIELAKIMKSKIMPWFAAVCAVGAYFASLALIIQRGFTPFYYIASAAGTAFICAYAYFLLKSLGKEKTSARAVFMALAGISFALAFLSRINSVLPAAAVTVAFVIIYAVKSFKEKKTARFIGEMAALALPVAAAGIFSLCYNQLRFGNPLEFGASYQLTVADASLYKLYAGGIVPSVYHYFFQGFSPTEKFPYIGISRHLLADYGKAVYIDSSFGIFAVPFMWLLFLNPAVFVGRRASAAEKTLLGVLLASVAATAFADFCLGGVIFRYTSDIAPAAAFACAFIAMSVCARAGEKNSPHFESAFKKGVAVISVLTVAVISAVGISLNGNLIQYAPDVYVSLKDFFVFWN